MAKFIQKFENQSAYDSAEHQYPNTSLVGTDIVFAMAAPAFGGLTVKYNIVNPTQEVTLFNAGGGSSTSSSTSGSGSGGALPTTMIVDGVSETPINTWRFETAGEHIVQYEFADNTVPDNFLLNLSEPKEVIIGNDIINIHYGSFNTGLTSATCLSTTPVDLEDSDVFGGSENYPIYVPAESVEAYKAASMWSYLTSRIFAIQ